MYTGSLKGPRAVYYLYGPNDVILYIGMTKDLRARFAVHKCKYKDTELAEAIALRLHRADLQPQTSVASTPRSSRAALPSVPRLRFS